MGQTGNRGWGSERKAASPSGLGQAGPWRGLPAQREGRQLARGRRECSSAPQPRAQQKLQAGVRQPPSRASRVQCAFPRDLATRPPFASLHLPQPLPARSLLGRNCQALLFVVCLLFTAVLERALGSVLRGGGEQGSVGAARISFQGAREGHSQRKTRRRE